MTNRGGRAAARGWGKVPLLIASAVTAGWMMPAWAGSDRSASGSDDTSTSPRAGGGSDTAQVESAPSSDARDDAGILALRRALAAAPGDAEASYRLGLALRRARRRTESVPYFERAVAIGPATRDRLLDLGVAYSDVSRFTESESAYRRLLAQSPGDADAYLNLANVALRRGEFTSAIDLYRQATAANPHELLAWYHLGHTLKFLGRQGEAREAYGRVLELTPADEREQAARVDALYQIGSMDLSRGRFEAAEGLFAGVIKAAPEHRGAHWGRAQALLHLGRGEEAKREIEAHARLLAARPPTGPSASGP